jgi:Protein of unknown function (DUF3800)
MLDIFFSDDARQANPSRQQMGPLVASGYVHVSSEAVRDLEHQLGLACQNHGFPPGPEGEFKWSPGRRLWMRDNLIAEERTAFFLEVLNLAADAGVTAGVVICDESRSTATDCDDHATDVSRLLIERVEWRLSRVQRHGVIVVDRPSGDREAETKFLSECLETISSGTDYVKPERIAINVVSSPSALVRSLQLADLVVSATTSYVAGESQWAPRVFPAIRNIMASQSLRIGGVGLKLHPDFVYANLYHWLLGDALWLKRGQVVQLPMAGYPYAVDQGVY